MRCVWSVLAAATVLACSTSDATSRRRALESDAARRLVGAWDVSFVADSTSMAFRMRGSSDRVTGTIAFTLNRSGADADAMLRDITHEGAYDLDFSPFGFTTRLADAPAVAVARLASSTGTSRDADSLWIVLSPGSEQFPLLMRGMIGGDSARGTWSAQAFSAGGGAGRFVMRRHLDPR
jgi:hypothetical protein